MHASARSASAGHRGQCATQRNGQGHSVNLEQILLNTFEYKQTTAADRRFHGDPSPRCCLARAGGLCWQLAQHSCNGQRRALAMEAPRTWSSWVPATPDLRHSRRGPWFRTQTPCCLRPAKCQHTCMACIHLVHACRSSSSANRDTWRDDARLGHQGCSRHATSTAIP